jgi:hypothetical protein
MPTPPLEEPTKKVTHNLWKSDYEYLKAKYEHWSVKVRDLVREFVRSETK